MSSPNLLVHTIDNNLDNIDVLISGAALSKCQTDKESICALSEIIREQMNKVLENAELYYLEDSSCAKNKEQVFLLEYIQYLYCLIEQTCTTSTTSLIVPQKYKGIDIELNQVSLQKISEILNYLILTSNSEINNVELVSLDNQIHIKINLEKIEEQGLQIK